MVPSPPARISSTGTTCTCPLWSRARRRTYNRGTGQMQSSCERRYLTGWPGLDPRTNGRGGGAIPERPARNLHPEEGHKLRRPADDPARPRTSADPSPSRQTIQQIRKMATGAPFRRGRYLYDGGMITSAKMAGSTPGHGAHQGPALAVLTPRLSQGTCQQAPPTYAPAGPTRSIRGGCTSPACARTCPRITTGAAR